MVPLLGVIAVGAQESANVTTGLRIDHQHERISEVIRDTLILLKKKRPNSASWCGVKMVFENELK